MNKLYDRIDFRNGSVPALNESNLNAMSKAIDDIDTRVTTIAGVQQVIDKAEDIIRAGAAIIAEHDGIEIATTEKAGLVKPDGTSIKILADGTLSTRVDTYIDPDSNNAVSNKAVSKFVEDKHKQNADDIKGVDDNLKALLKGVDVFAQGVIDGRLVAKGDYYDLDPGAFYLLVTSTYLNTGAWRGHQVWGVSSAHDIASGTTATALPRFSALGSTGTVGATTSSTYYIKDDGGYGSRIGIGSCTTACRVRYSLIKVMGSEDDFDE